METRCILCDGPFDGVGKASALPTDSERLCTACKVLPPEERKTLRDRAMTRMIRDRDD